MCCKARPGISIRAGEAREKLADTLETQPGVWIRRRQRGTGAGISSTVQVAPDEFVAVVPGSAVPLNSRIDTNNHVSRCRIAWIGGACGRSDLRARDALVSGLARHDAGASPLA